MVKYSENHCNICGCSEPIYRHHMCEKHYRQYMSNPIVQKIGEEYEMRENGNRSMRLKIKQVLHFLFHYSFDIPMYHIEHFPLEHVFLGNMKHLSMSSTIDMDFANSLMRDFDCQENENLPMLKRIIDSKSLDNMPIDEKESYELESKDLPSFKPMILCIIGFILAYIALRIADYNEDTLFIEIPFSKVISESRKLIFQVPIVIIMIYTGLRLPSLYNSLIMRAYNLKLFTKADDNFIVLREAMYVKDRGRKLDSYKASVAGIILGNVSKWAILFILFSTVNYYTVILFLGCMCIFETIVIINTLIVPYFPIYESIKKKVPEISLSFGDYCGGLKDYLKMQLYTFTYNELFLYVGLSILHIFDAAWWIYVIFFFITINRCNHAGAAMIMSIKSITSFYKQKRKLLNDLKNSDTEDTIDKIERLKKVRLLRLPGIITTLCVTIIIPLCVSISANNISKISEYLGELFDDAKSIFNILAF